MTRLPRLLVVGALLLLATQAVAIAAQSTPPPMIRAIEIRRVSVFDSAEASNVFFRLANRLHYGTRESVIRPELLFRVGEPYDSATAAESVRNLRSLGLFSDVRIATIRTDSGVIEQLTTRDAWSTSLGVDVATTGSQSSVNTQISETNLLGTGSRLAASYGTYPDHTALAFQFANPRLIGNRVGLVMSHEQRSDGHESDLVLDHPFRAIASPFGVSLLSREFDGRVFRYFGGQPVPRDTLHNETAQLLLQAARAIHASSRGYLRLGVIAQVLRNDYLADSATASFPKHVAFTIGPTLAFSRANFKTTTNYDHLQQPEDIDLSTTIAIGAMLVTRAWGNPDNGMAPFASFRIGKEVPGGLVILAGLGSGLFTRTGLDSGTAVLGATAAFQLGSMRQHLLLHSEGGMSKHAAPVDQFDLGFGLGPRGFDAHAFTGNRSHYSTAEYRYTIAPELGSVAGIALAAFADYGGAWFAGHPVRSGTDAGIGLRLGPTRQADLRTIRIDLVRRFANDVLASGWVVSIGKGFTFSVAQ